MGDNPILQAVTRTLRLIYPEGLSGKSIMDVGCLEGGFATEFARLGMNALGLEVRQSNFENCLRVKAGIDLPNLSFVRDDAMNIGTYPAVDVMFVCGLLYHLDDPRKFIADASRICGRAIFLETHVAAEDGEASVALHKLSEMTVLEGLRGRWFPEYADVSVEELEKLKWASWSNNKSFWVQKEYLLQLLKEAGFNLVFEQYDCVPAIVPEYTQGWRKQNARVLLVGIR